jgi:hypothetical protein
MYNSFPKMGTIGIHLPSHGFFSSISTPFVMYCMTFGTNVSRWSMISDTWSVTSAARTIAATFSGVRSSAARLSDAAIRTIEEWVRRGLPWPDDGKTAAGAGFDLAKRRAEHWCWQAPERATAPPVTQAAWCRGDIDRFVLARLEAAGIAPAPEADRVALVRRATFDLTGLPPTPDEVAAFVADTRPDAWERVIDRLLASPRYGEKWGRFWLDLVRYADTNGFERDGDKPDAWKYRDWVVQAFNDDKPYDRFVLEQLAGDELPDRDFGSLVATGYYRLGMWDDEVPDLAQAQADDMDGIVDITARTFLGIPMGCVRCHDHKGDPIPHRDYYRFAAFFAGVRPYKTSPFNSIAAENVVAVAMASA